jgi:hypothetical protein
MHANVPVRFGKGPMEKDRRWDLASGLLHGWEPPSCSHAHDMRNECAERVLPTLKDARERNRERKQVSAKRHEGMKGKTRKRSVDVRSDQEQHIEKAARTSAC